jgi:hypothetical protein
MKRLVRCDFFSWAFHLVCFEQVVVQQEAQYFFQLMRLGSVPAVVDTAHFAAYWLVPAGV